jgi:hypothetical protein
MPRCHLFTLRENFSNQTHHLKVFGGLLQNVSYNRFATAHESSGLISPHPCAMMYSSDLTLEVPFMVIMFQFVDSIPYIRRYAGYVL